ncbi:MAG: 3-hydroxyacyl-CoA dehydrogenase [Kiloniellaceae bacterium]
MSETKVAIVGSGLIGRAWAIAFSRGGCRVALFDPEAGAAARARGLIAKALGDLADNGLLAGAAPADVLERMSVAEHLAEALEGAVYAQESAPEVLEVKVAITADMGALAGADTVLASSTSGFVPSSFTETAPGRHRCLVAHPINPPYLLPAVEVVPAVWTDPSIVERARALLESVGQVPIVMTREIDGFVLNRLQGALLHEAFRLVAGGYVSARDLDRAVVGGLGPRWSFMGPFETIDLNAPGGIRQYVERYGALYARLAETQTEPCDWPAALDAGIEAERAAALARAEIAARQAWRDRRLMALAGHKKDADSTFGE